MKTSLFRAVLLGSSLLTVVAATNPALAQIAPATSTAALAKRPNFLIIVADDLGYTDLGAFGGNIDTPNLDELALHGLRLTGFHSAPTCSPTRAELLTGTDNHLVGLGNMAESTAPNQKGADGYEGFLRADTATLPEILRANGYRTLLSGKWHLGTEKDQDPSKRGFERSFTLLQGAHNHFGKGINIPFIGSTYREDGQTLSSLPKDFYSSDYFADKLVEYLKETKAGPEGGKPFFAYLAFTAPHWPVQAPAETIAKYRHRFDDGPIALRAARLKKEEELGLVPPGTVAHDLVLRHSSEWDKLTPEEKAQYTAAQEVYAAMVDRVDQNVGKVIAQLKASGEYDNTVILFLADNGSEAYDVYNADVDLLKNLSRSAKNTPENIGAENSFFSYGAGWAQAGNSPSYLFKGYASEGGTRVVSFLDYAGFKHQGEISHVFGTVQDVAPTFLELAGVAAPQGTFEGRKIQPIRGKSWAPYLRGEADTVHAAGEPVGTELFGSRSIREGDWKILTERAGDDWKLFNIADDPAETTDLSAQQPEKKAELIAAWQAYAKSSNVIIPDKSLYNP